MLSNDPKKRSTSLIFKGLVKKFVSITPRQVRLIGTEGQDLVRTVRIVPNRESPFKLLTARPIDPKLFSVKLKEVKGKNGPEYEISVTNVAKKEGRYSSLITLGTDSKLKPEIKIQVSLYLRKKV